MKMIDGISIVIPIFDEVDVLKRQLKLLIEQTKKPNEIVIVSASPIEPIEELIDKFNLKDNYSEYKIIYNKNGLPGGNRNAGITSASHNWIALIDAAIYPEPDWIESLVNCVEENNALGVFGICKFNGNSIFEKAVCALSYGCNSILPVLPASLFHRSVFDKIGYFDDTLRSGEDILWIRKFIGFFGDRLICNDALVHYLHHPKTLISIFKKWFIYEKNAVVIGVNKIQQLLLLVLFLIISIVSIISFIWGLSALTAYIILRGFIDPMRRSRSFFWYKDKPSAVLIALGICAVIDFSKLSGFIVGFFQKMINYRSYSK